MSTKAKTKANVGGAVRHRKVLRDNIQGLTKPAFRRLLARAGVKRASGLIYEELRAVIKVGMQMKISESLQFTEYERRKTCTQKDLAGALEVHGKYLAAGFSAHKTSKSNKSKTANVPGSLKTCRARSPAEKKRATKRAAGEAPKRTLHFRPGTKALKNIRRAQKNSDCLVFPAQPFARLIKEIAQDFKTDVRFSAPFYKLLQLTIENWIVDLCTHANGVAVHAKRQGLMPKDLQLVRKIRGERA